MMIPSDVMRRVWDRLEAPDRMALDFALPPGDKMATKTERRLAMLDYADRHGKLRDPAKDVLEFLQANPCPTADRLLRKHANVALKIRRLEQAMASGVYGPPGDYPTPAECDPFDVWYGLCKILGSLSPDRFDAFMAQKRVAATVLVSTRGHRFAAVMESCDPILLEHILSSTQFGHIAPPDGDVHARKNGRYLTPQTVQKFKERGLAPERWARYLEVALSAGAMDVAEMVMAEGYRFDRTSDYLEREHDSNCFDAEIGRVDDGPQDD